MQKGSLGLLSGDDSEETGEAGLGREDPACHVGLTEDSGLLEGTQEWDGL